MEFVDSIINLGGPPNLIALFMGVSLATCSPNFGVHSSHIKFLGWKFDFKNQNGTLMALMMVPTVWKFHKFSITKILREIKIGESTEYKNIPFSHI